MATYESTADPKTISTGSLGKRFFAWMIAKGNAKYERAVADRKRSLFSDLHGNVLEIGPGAGVNLSFYPADIRWLGAEPNPFMHQYLNKEAERLGLNIDLRSITADRLEAEDNSMDVVVSTLVLCSVPDPAATLKEILRVLKPGGCFLFIEHVAAPSATLLRKAQRVVRPIWKIVADGCHTDRDILTAIKNAGFTNVSHESFKAPIPIVSPHIAGSAIK